jgi:hypothetical protein
MKQLITNYTFDASAKTITFGDFASIDLESVLVITNVTDNVLIYNFANPALGGIVGSNVLTLNYDTTSMDDTDSLQIFYDVATDYGPGNATDTGTQRVVIASDNPSVTVDGTFWQATQPVSLASVPTHAVTQSGTWNVGLSTGSNAIGSITNTSFASTQSGTWTVDLGATDNAVLDAIASSTGKLDTVVSGNELQVDIVGALPAGTNAIGKLAQNNGIDIGDVTINNTIAAPVYSRITDGTNYMPTGDAAARSIHTTIDNASINVNATLSATDNGVLDTIAANTNSIKTAVELIDNAISGTEMQVDIVASLPTGTNSIGKVTLNSNTDGTYIGDIKFGESLPAGTNSIGSITNTSFAATQSGTWNINNISGTVSLPTGASTSAKQDTIIGHVDGIETLLTTIDADTSVLAGAIASGQMQVDVVAPLPAGTNAIGKLAANSGVDIGDVTINNTLGAGTNDASTIRITESSAASSTVTQVASSASNVTLKAANTARRGLTVYNDSSAILRLKLGATASATSFTVILQPQDYYEVPANYNGIVDGIWATANGYAYVTEVY